MRVESSTKTSSRLGHVPRAAHRRARAADMLASVSARPSPSPPPSPRPARRANRAPLRRESLSARRGSALCASASTSGTDVARPDGFGFSAAGMIFPYHCGAWEVLSELGLLTPDTPVAGASAGALVAAMHACGMSPSEGKRVLTAVLRDCRENGVLGRVGGVLERALRAELPADAHELCSRNNLFVSVSSPRFVKGEERRNGESGFNGTPFALENALVSKFESNDDLIGALLSSCHIPVYCGWPVRLYRNKWCVDGGWTNLAPVPPVCESAARVASFPLVDAWRGAPDGDGKASGNAFEQSASFWSGWGDFDDADLLIAPDGAEGTSSVEYATLGKWALLPQDDETLEELARMGRADAERWAAKRGYERAGECEDACEIAFG